MEKNSLKLKYNVEWKTINKKTGEILSQGKKHNLIVNTGLIHVPKLLGKGLSTNQFSKIAIGTGDALPNEIDSTLESQEDIVEATIEYESDYKVTFNATFEFESAMSITEAGIFSDTGNIMLNRVTFEEQNVGSDVDYYIKFTILVGRG